MDQVWCIAVVLFSASILQLVKTDTTNIPIALGRIEKDDKWSYSSNSSNKVRASGASNINEIKNIQIKKFLPRIFVIGDVFCKTSALNKLLTAHPQICKTVTMETHFFDTIEAYDKGLLFYYETFFKGKCENEQSSIDVTPTYFENSIDVPRRILSSFREQSFKLKFILILKEPVDGELSRYEYLVKHCVRRMNFAMKDLSRPSNGWDAAHLCDDPRCKDLDCEKRAKFASSQNPSASLASFLEYTKLTTYHTQRGNYAHHIANWLKYFNRKQLLIISYTDLINQTPKTIQIISKFLHLTYTREWNNFQVTPIMANDRGGKAQISCDIRDTLALKYVDANKDLAAFLQHPENRLEPESDILFTGFEEFPCLGSSSMPTASLLSLRDKDMKKRSQIANVSSSVVGAGKSSRKKRSKQSSDSNGIDSNIKSTSGNDSDNNDHRDHSGRYRNRNSHGSDSSNTGTEVNLKMYNKYHSDRSSDSSIDSSGNSSSDNNSNKSSRKSHKKNNIFFKNSDSNDHNSNGHSARAESKRSGKISSIKGNATTSALWPVDSSITLPVYIIGSAQCGIQELVIVLHTHTEVCKHNLNQETNFFNDNESYNKGINFYHDRFFKGKCAPNHQTFDITSSYFVNADVVPERMKQSFSAVQLAQLKLVLLLRDPAEREFLRYEYLVKQCVRYMNGYVKGKARPANGWNTTELCYPKRCSELDCTTRAQYAKKDYMYDYLIPFAEYISRPSYSTSGSEYSKLLQKWLKYFNRKQLFIINYHDLLGPSYRSVLKQLRLFIGLKSGWESKNMTFPLPSVDTVRTALRNQYDCVTRDKLTGMFEEEFEEVNTSLLSKFTPVLQCRGSSESQKLKIIGQHSSEAMRTTRNSTLLLTSSSISKSVLLSGFLFCTSCFIFVISRAFMNHKIKFYGE